MQSRITITIPEDLVEAADEQAKRLDRSRSWVLVDALRRYLHQARRSRTVSKSVAPPYRPPREAPIDAATEVAASRRRHLRAELSLPALEQLRRAEELARLGQPSDVRRPSAQVVGFDSYEDYYEWKKNRLIRV